MIKVKVNTKKRIRKNKSKSRVKRASGSIRPAKKTVAKALVQQEKPAARQEEKALPKTETKPAILSLAAKLRTIAVKALAKIKNVYSQLRSRMPVPLKQGWRRLKPFLAKVWLIMRTRKIFKYAGRTLLAVAIFYSGMLFQMYRELNPRTRNADIDTKEVMGMISQLTQRQYLTGTVVAISEGSLTLELTDGTTAEIILPKNLIVLGSGLNRSNLAKLPAGTALMVTVEKNAQDQYSAVRVKQE